ncbi:MAG: hypothetical protein V1797_14660 [Pseudomonadota bacterium]
MAFLVARKPPDPGTAAQVEAEARLALGHLVMARWAFLGLALVLLLLWAGPGHDLRVMLAGLSLIVPFAAYNYWLARRLRAGRVAPWLNYLNVTSDLALVTLYLLLLSQRTSPLDMVTSSLNLGYPLIMLYAAFRLDQRLLLYSLALALVLYNGLYFLRAGGIAPELLTMAPTLGGWGQVARSLILTLFGLGLMMIPQTVRHLLGRQQELFNAHQALEERYRQELETEVEQKTQVLRQANRELEKALADVKTLQGLLPICARCKKIRDEGGQWHSMESYIASRTTANITHGLCRDCLKILYPDFSEDVLADLEQPDPES